MAVHAVKTPPQSSLTPYESDFNLWCHETAALIREGRWKEIDGEHLAEEIEALANRDYREVDSRLAIVLLHLLKWHVQPGRRGSSWENTLAEQRRQLAYIFGSSPSLLRLFTRNWQDVYHYAVRKAVRETGLPERQFPAECPWTPEQVLDAQFYPDAAE